LQAVLSDLDALAATLVALTPQLPEHNRAMRDKNALNFHLLSDPGNAYAAELGLRFELPPDLKALYARFGIDLPKYNGDESWTLPVPARLVVDQDGTVRAADVDVDYTHRPEPTKTIEDLKAIV
jgi:peroxiredoxin